MTRLSFCALLLAAACDEGGGGWEVLAEIDCDNPEVQDALNDDGTYDTGIEVGPGAGAVGIWRWEEGGEYPDGYRLDVVDFATDSLLVSCNGYLADHPTFVVRL